MYDAVIHCVRGESGLRYNMLQQVSQLACQANLLKLYCVGIFLISYIDHYIWSCTLYYHITQYVIVYHLCYPVYYVCYHVHFVSFPMR